MTAFARGAFLESFIESPRPYIAAEVYELVLDGRSPLLTPGEVRSANAGEGLDFIALHFLLRNLDLANPGTREVLMAANAAFYFFQNGYRMRSLVQEVYGRDKAEFMENAGFRVVSDFAVYFAQRPVENPSPEEHPYLVRLGKEDIRPAAVSPLSFLFEPLAPRIYFSTAEQKVLERALLGESDEDMSESLGVSVDTVKKTWRRIYDRVDREIPQLLGLDASREERSSRGSEKRRHLLEYLRSHLEELRPAIRPRFAR